MVRNRLHSLLHRHNLELPEDGLVSQAWWDGQGKISVLEKIQIRQEIAMLEQIEKHKAEVDDELGRQSLGEVWGKQALRLMQLSGIGVVVSMTVLSAIGAIARFESANKLVGYAGLGARVHNSGMSTRSGRITKTGRRDLRVVLIEAAQIAANNHPHWKAELARLEPRLGRNKAIIAIARKLLVAVWYILAQDKTDRFADPERVAQKFLKFAYQLGKENRPAGQSAAQFVRHHLDALHLGSELTTIAWGSKKPIPLPPSHKQSERRPKWRLGAMNSSSETHNGVLRARRSTSLYNFSRRFAHHGKGGRSSIACRLANPESRYTWITPQETDPTAFRFGSSFPFHLLHPLTSHFICARCVGLRFWKAASDKVAVLKNTYLST